MALFIRTRLGEPKRALRYLRQAAEVGRRSGGSEHLEVTHVNACAVLSELGRWVHTLKPGLATHSNILAVLSKVLYVENISYVFETRGPQEGWLCSLLIHTMLWNQVLGWSFRDNWDNFLVLHVDISAGTKKPWSTQGRPYFTGRNARKSGEGEGARNGTRSKQKAAEVDRRAWRR